MISRVPVNSEDNEKNPLDPTEERMIFDNLWAHFWPTSNKMNQKVSSFSLSESYRCKNIKNIAKIVIGLQRNFYNFH